MKAFSADSIVLPLPEGHHFPAAKYVRLRQRIESSAEFASVDLRIPEPASVEQIALVHTREYIDRVVTGTLSPKEIRRIGLPWSTALVERSLRSVGGTLAACEAASKEGLALHLGGGTHHAFPDHGSGYCVFNDCAIAARWVQRQRMASRLLILDLDVHQGDATALIFASDPSIYTCSLHGAGNFPFHKQVSDLDLALPSGTTDTNYLDALRRVLPTVLEASRPEMILYLAGADPYRGDALGRLSLSKEGLAERDRLVLATRRAAGVPMVIVLAGGYARDIEDTVEIHLNTVRAALAG